MMQTIIFDKEIYSYVAIKQAIISYKKFAEIKIIDEGCQYICLINNTIYNLEETCREFDNHVLQLTIRMGGKKS